MTGLLLQSGAFATEWRLETHWAWAPWVTVLVLGLIVAAVVACYRYEATPAGVGYRGLLTGLRLVTVGLILLMLSEAVFSRARVGKPRLAILVDRSESMQREDAPASSGEKRTREQAARDLLLENRGSLLKQLGREFDLDCLFVDSQVETIAAAPDGLRFS